MTERIKFPISFRLIWPTPRVNPIGTATPFKPMSAADSLAGALTVPVDGIPGAIAPVTV